MNKYILLIILTITTSCRETRHEEKKPLLLADREAPLGWVYLRIFEDSTFEFESRGLERRGTIYSGTIELQNDTIYFHYKDSIPSAGQMAILTKSQVVYFGGDYHERVEIKLNKLNED